MTNSKPFDFFIQWHLTEKCNLACRHCYQDERGSDELTLAEITDTATEASDMILEWSAAYGIPFSPSMNITGGEPFLRTDLFAILRCIKEKGFKVFLLTNGTLVNRSAAKALAGIGVDGVQVSIEGAEGVHDRLRGTGSFSASAAGIEHLVDCGLPVTLNVTLSALNAGEMNKILAFGARAGAASIGFSRLVPGGKGRELASQMLETDKLKELYQWLLSREVTGRELVTGDPLASQMNDSEKEDRGSFAVGGCAAGVSGLTIRPDGTVLPCRRLPLPLGNVRKEGLRELWATAPVLEALRDRNRYSGRCRSCYRWAYCRGCRAIAFAWSRHQGKEDFLADDPQCFHC